MTYAEKQIARAMYEAFRRHSKEEYAAWDEITPDDQAVYVDIVTELLVHDWIRCGSAVA